MSQNSPQQSFVLNKLLKIHLELCGTNSALFEPANTSESEWADAFKYLYPLNTLPAHIVSLKVLNRMPTLANAKVVFLSPRDYTH